ncbi:hypothetical protein DEU56DRAFT_757515 [Suillus clintonianus]|uniref:uncharacterized protein n=1 Tax=Suillus clintonianus TaxID=1904413 RepID=UPI001B85C999|nr:uncharacterized protein DEU56DRAFT_757515 [Suillus clintonianus]KAG2131624.1 hypothetical protein DEU56DRAFT_757515 [Suillus clintonianus]
MYVRLWMKIAWMGTRTKTTKNYPVMPVSCIKFLVTYALFEVCTVLYYEFARVVLCGTTSIAASSLLSSAHHRQLDASQIATSSTSFPNDYGCLMMALTHTKEPNGNFDLDFLYGRDDWDDGGAAHTITHPPYRDLFKIHRTPDLTSMRRGEIPHTGMVHVDSRPRKKCETHIEANINALNTICGPTTSHNSRWTKYRCCRHSTSACDGHCTNEIQIGADVRAQIEQYHSVSQSLSIARGKIVEIARSGVPYAYELYRSGNDTSGRTPIQYQIHIVTALVNSLSFMHSYRFDAACFFFGFLRYEHFLDESLLQKLWYVVATAGAAVHCVLQEQGLINPTVDPFSGLGHHNKFIKIINTLDGLEGEEKITFEAYILDILEVGPLQMRTVAEADNDDLQITFCESSLLNLFPNDYRKILTQLLSEICAIYVMMFKCRLGTNHGSLCSVHVHEEAIHQLDILIMAHQGTSDEAIKLNSFNSQWINRGLGQDLFACR